MSVAPERCDQLVDRLRAVPTLAASVIGEMTNDRGIITVVQD